MADGVDGRQVQGGRWLGIVFLRSQGVVDGADGRQVEGGRELGIMPWPSANASQLLHQRGWREPLWRAMTDVTLTMLIAGIPPSHLRMHLRESDNRNDCNDRNNGPSSDGEGGLPLTVLVDAAASAADLVLPRGALMTDNHCNNDDVCAAVIGGADGASDNALEGFLLVLNKETAQGQPSTVPNGEVEHWNVVTHLFRIALKVAGLATGRLILVAVDAINALLPFLVFFFLLPRLQLLDAHNDMQSLSET
jgi:hypothetical protein